MTYINSFWQMSQNQQPYLEFLLYELVFILARAWAEWRRHGHGCKRFVPFMIPTTQQSLTFSVCVDNNVTKSHDGDRAGTTVIWPLAPFNQQPDGPHVPVSEMHLPSQTEVRLSGAFNTLLYPFLLMAWTKLISAVTIPHHNDSNCSVASDPWDH